ncbi:3-dehydroquinate synthase [Endomicrobiia bacterium]|nr:3-dehydroquinate synthase [Endomicrobiia bacterium]GHT36848.1 3-dehydroquinate synthase [Endomicrobiia bacterium]GHT46051.1 3-dehydroquinate synthase [Endomicrobiia bacterium]
MKKLITVNLKANKYTIVISQHENEFLTAFKKAVKTNTFFVITDKNVEKLHLEYLADLLKKQKGFNVKTAVISAGESGKSIKNLSLLYNKALEAGIDRKSCVIALGGGVVGDIAGFFAATYMRGIDFVQIPTTILAMTDSSVGGKTAINTNSGKNIAGAFYQPKLVWINSCFLSTLPVRHVKNGLSEVIKYAFIFDKEFYAYLLDMFKKDVISSDNFDYIIYQSCSYKAKVVEKDEKEITGLRAILNFGHTFAHALETATNYKKFLHGEAVAIGMLFAADLSLELKICKPDTYKEVEDILLEAGFNLNVAVNTAQFLSLMKKDKKSVNGNIKFVLIKDIGKTINSYVEDSIVLNVLKKFTGENK